MIFSPLFLCVVIIKKLLPTIFIFYYIIEPFCPKVNIYKWMQMNWNFLSRIDSIVKVTLSLKSLWNSFSYFYYICAVQTSSTWKSVWTFFFIKSRRRWRELMIFEICFRYEKYVGTCCLIYLLAVRQVSANWFLLSYFKYLLSYKFYFLFNTVIQLDKNKQK